MQMVNKEPFQESTRNNAPRGLADMLGLTAAINMLRRRMWLVTGVGVGAAIITFAAIMLQPTVYTATSTLIFNSQVAATSNSPQQTTPIEAEIALLRSPALMNELALALGMQGNDTQTAGLAADLANAITVEQRDRPAPLLIFMRARPTRRGRS